MQLKRGHAGIPQLEADEGLDPRWGLCTCGCGAWSRYEDAKSLGEMFRTTSGSGRILSPEEKLSGQRRKPE